MHLKVLVMIQNNKVTKNPKLNGSLGLQQFKIRMDKNTKIINVKHDYIQRSLILSPQSYGSNFQSYKLLVDISDPSTLKCQMSQIDLVSKQQHAKKLSQLAYFVFPNLHSQQAHT